MESIRDIIPQVIENLSQKKPNTQRNIHEVWKIVVKEHADHCAVTGFKDGILRVHVDSSARMFQLSTLKVKYLKDLKSEIPDIRDIVFKVGKIH